MRHHYFIAACESAEKLGGSAIAHGALWTSTGIAQVFVGWLVGQLAGQ